MGIVSSSHSPHFFPTDNRCLVRAGVPLNRSLMDALCEVMEADVLLAASGSLSRMTLASVSGEQRGFGRASLADQGWGGEGVTNSAGRVPPASSLPQSPTIRPESAAAPAPPLSPAIRPAPPPSPSPPLSVSAASSPPPAPSSSTLSSTALRPRPRPIIAEDVPPSPSSPPPPPPLLHGLQYQGLQPPVPLPSSPPPSLFLPLASAQVGHLGQQQQQHEGGLQKSQEQQGELQGGLQRRQQQQQEGLQRTPQHCLLGLAWVLARSRGPAPRRAFVKQLVPALLAVLMQQQQRQQQPLLTVQQQQQQQPLTTVGRLLQRQLRDGSDDSGSVSQRRRLPGAEAAAAGNAGGVTAGLVGGRATADLGGGIVTASICGGSPRDVASCTWALGKLEASLDEGQAVSLLELSEGLMKVGRSEVWGEV